MSKAPSTAEQRIDRKRIALLHVAKAKLGMSDEDYRAMLDSFGVTSSVELTIGKFAAVMDRMKAGGFEGNQSRPTSSIPSVSTQKRRMMRKLEAVLHEMGLSREYADGISRKMFGVDKVAWLEAGQLYKVLQALMVYRKRQSRDGES